MKRFQIRLDGEPVKEVAKKWEIPLWLYDNGDKDTTFQITDTDGRHLFDMRYDNCWALPFSE